MNSAQKKKDNPEKPALLCCPSRDRDRWALLLQGQSEGDPPQRTSQQESRKMDKHEATVGAAVLQILLPFAYEFDAEHHSHIIVTQVECGDAHFKRSRGVEGGNDGDKFEDIAASPTNEGKETEEKAAQKQIGEEDEEEEHNHN